MRRFARNRADVTTFEEIASTLLSGPTLDDCSAHPATARARRSAATKSS